MRGASTSARVIRPRDSRSPGVGDRATIADAHPRVLPWTRPIASEERMATKRVKPAARPRKSGAKRGKSTSTPGRSARNPGHATPAAGGAPGVATFLAALPPDRRAEVQRVRDVINANVPPGYVETSSGKFLAWVVPLDVYPDTYNGQALWYAAIASGKSAISLHAMLAYMNDPLTRRLEQGFAAAGKKLDMGKACIRFKRADDLALDVIGEVIASTPLEAYVARAKAAKSRRTG